MSSYPVGPKCKTCGQFSMISSDECFVCAWNRRSEIEKLLSDDWEVKIVEYAGKKPQILPGG